MRESKDLGEKPGVPAWGGRSKKRRKDTSGEEGGELHKKKETA